MAAERFGAVEVQRGRRDRGHLIERVRVRDPDLLARHLGRPTASVMAQRARDELLPIATSGEPWVVRLLDEMAGRWARSESAYRLNATQIEADTKAFDRHASRLAAVLGVQIGQPGAMADVVWAHIGLERYSHPVHLKGPIVVEGPSGRLVDGVAKPFASVHPEMLPQLSVLETPTAILTIENYASFNRQVREIDDGSLVVYTGGFPSAAVIELLSKVLAVLPAEVRFLHWGDIDSGGLRIFRYLEENLPRGPQPHLMTKELANSHGQPADPDASLAAIANSESAVAALAQWLAFDKAPMTLEQEALDPVLP